MAVIYTQYYKSGFGELIIGDYNGKICLCDWRYRKMRSGIDKRIKRFFNAEYVFEKTDLISQIIFQLQEYEHSGRTEFDIPLHLIGTNFQKEVWEMLLKVPYGTTLSYLSLAKKLNNEKGIRAVASANGANAISIIIPCHRIIASDGSLTGYAGGLNTKKKLLQLEGSYTKNKQLHLF